MKHEMRARALWVTLYAVAMAFVEAAVVVYLRRILMPGDPSAAAPAAGIAAIPAIEGVREAATIVMLVAVAALAGGDLWGRFLWFSFAFGIWDIGYYVWLRVLIGWPVTLLDWDVLFLIPVPWVAPVLAPVLISLGLVIGSLVLLRFRTRGAVLRFSPWHWGLAVLGGVVVLLSFTLDYRLATAGQEPASFRWLLFGAGMGVALAAFAAGVRRFEWQR